VPVLDGTCSLRLTRRYVAPPAEVWDALSDAGSMGRWLALPRAIELRAGGRFELELPGEKSVEGKVREIEPGRVLELDWSFDGEQPSVVRFELSEDGDGTVLVLEHRQIEEPVGMVYIARWEGVLERLGEEVAR
jgi:uncharacterized protein YndB with AHSA1/START domain